MAHIITPISIDVRTQRPLEPKRGPVAKKGDLVNAETWSSDTFIGEDGKQQYVFYVYPGMLIPVIGTQEIYMLIDPAQILNEDFSGWALVSGGGGNFIYDGGSAREIYTTEQVMDAGNAINEKIIE